MSIYTAQAKPTDFVEFNEFEAKPLDGWEWDKDERLEDLVNQLREKESSLQALDARIAKAMGRKAGAKMDENMAWRSTRRMDLNGGGPVRWDAFYGRNAEKFFYHPVDPNTTYHTRTLLQQTDPLNAGGVPGNQGVPAHQRPPQFDYIYRGYEKEQERASGEMSKLASKMDVLTARRRQLENDVVILWFKLAFRVIDKEKLPEKAILRFAMVPKKQGKEDFERATALTSATQLLASALLFNEAFVEKEPDRAFRTLEAMIKKNRQKFEDGLLKARTLLEESEDRGTSLGKYKLLTRKLEDVSKSISEGYRGWKDGDRAEDEPAKYASLRRVQDSVVTYSQILLSLNELAGVMKKDWVMGLNTDTPAFVPVWDVAYVAPPPEPEPKPATTRTSKQLEKSLVGTLWKNTNGFFFEWDMQGRVWHYHEDNTGARSPVVIAYADGDKAKILFINQARQTVIFDGELKTLQQIGERDEVVATAVRKR